MKPKQTMLFILIFILISLRCDTTEPPVKGSLSLTVEDVSCTEAWLMLKPSNLSLPVEVTLYKNNVVAQNNILCYGDTLLYVDSLLPKQNYTYQVSGIGNPVSSNAITVTTLDTTSHNFTFQTFTFGEHSSSVLYDVAIINENNIWAVGEIYMKDSLGNNDPTFYNAVHWNGTDWELKKIFYKGGIWVIRTVFAFNANDIWFSGYMRYDGTKFIELPIPSILMGWQINKLWGSSSNDLYAVGNGGNIAHYSNGSWTKIESGTTLGLADVYGNENGLIFVCGGNLNTGQGIVLKINKNNSTTKIIDSYYYGTGFDSAKMFTENLYGPLVGIWVNKSGTTYTLGNLIYRYNLGRWAYAKGIEHNDLSSGYFSGRGFSWSIRGKENNDFIFVGERNTVRYFNGIRAIQIGEPFSYTSAYRWYKVDYKQNTAVTVGSKGGFAAVIVFKK